MATVDMTAHGRGRVRQCERDVARDAAAGLSKIQREAAELIDVRRQARPREAT